MGGPYGPYRQSERLSFYHAHIQSLLNNSHAYRCFCSTERIDDLNRRRHDKGLPLGYDRKCTHLSPAEVDERVHNRQPHVIRFRAPEQWPRYNDLIYGKTGHGAEKAKKLLVDEPVYEDSVLVKSDGFPTYHWANVCDDHDMNITHVVRGSEWMSSTPLHVALYNSLDWTPPVFAHVPLLVDANRQKLSKRNFDSDISSFRSKGIYPEALLNFAALLGWSHQKKSDVMDLATLTSLFDLKITKGNTIVSFDKLNYLQEHHARRRIEAGGPEFEQIIRDVAVAVLERYGAPRIQSLIGSRSLHDVLAVTLRIKSLPYRTAEEFASQLSIFLDPVPSPLPPPSFIPAGQTWLLHPLRVASSTLLLVPGESWNQATHHSNLSMLETSSFPDRPSSSTPEVDNDNDAVTNLTAKQWKSHLYHYLRWALLGGRTGPGIAETLDLLGPETSRQRIQSANQRSKDVEVEMTRPVLKDQGWKGDGDGKRRVDKVWTGHSLPSASSSSSP